MRGGWEGGGAEYGGRTMWRCGGQCADAEDGGRGGGAEDGGWGRGRQTGRETGVDGLGRMI